MDEIALLHTTGDAQADVVLRVADLLPPPGLERFVEREPSSERAAGPTSSTAASATPATVFSPFRGDQEAVGPNGAPTG